MLRIFRPLLVRPVMSLDPSEESTKFNQAIDACLERCTASPMPFTTLRDFLKELEEAGWSPEDLKVVEEATIRALNGQ